jgi:hypothetical protein
MLSLHLLYAAPLPVAQINACVARTVFVAINTRSQPVITKLIVEAMATTKKIFFVNFLKLFYGCVTFTLNRMPLLYFQQQTAFVEVHRNCIHSGHALNYVNKRVTRFSRSLYQRTSADQIILHHSTSASIFAPQLGQ